MASTGSNLGQLNTNRVGSSQRHTSFGMAGDKRKRTAQIKKIKSARLDALKAKISELKGTDQNQASTETDLTSDPTPEAKVSHDDFISQFSKGKQDDELGAIEKRRILKKFRKIEKSQQSSTSLLEPYQGRQKVQFTETSDHKSSLQTRASLLSKDNLDSLLQCHREGKITKIACQTKAFPKLQIKVPSLLAQSLREIKMGNKLHATLMEKTGYHEDTLARLGLTRPFEDYAKQPFVTEVESTEQQQQQAQSQFMGLEFFALLKKQCDVRTEYSNYEELKRMRQAYITHILDVVLGERSQVGANDRAIAAQEKIERDASTVNLDNVFEIAKKAEAEADSENEDGESKAVDGDSEKEASDAEKDQVALKTERIEDNGLISADAVPEATPDSRDQALVRPKVLILAPFKQMAYQIIEQIIMTCNHGKWKKASKKKKFRDEFGTEDEAFNDFFRIGISLNSSKKSGSTELHLKLYEQFYASDIIVASPLAIRMLAGHKVDDKANDLGEKAMDQDFLASIEYLVLDQAEAFVFQNMEHVEEVLKALNNTPKKLTQLNDITRIRELYSAKIPKVSKSIADDSPEAFARGITSYAPLLRQNIVISKFRNVDLDFALNESCSTNLFGQAHVQKIHPNRAKSLAQSLSVQVTLKKIPPVKSFEHADGARFHLFTKTLWSGIYEDNTVGYTVLLVPNYFDFVKLKNFFRQRNCQVAMISEYTEKKECQRMRTAYEHKEMPVMMITERALIFQKIRVRFARNVILYAIPESSDILDESVASILDVAGWDMILKHRLMKIKAQSTSKDSKMTGEETALECRKIIKEGRDLQTAQAGRSLVCLFSKFDGLVLERFVGTAKYRSLIDNEAKDVFVEKP